MLAVNISANYRYVQVYSSFMNAAVVRVVISADLSLYNML